MMLLCFTVEAIPSPIYMEAHTEDSSLIRRHDATSHQYHFEVYSTYMISYIIATYWESGTTILAMIEAPTLLVLRR